MTRVALVAGLNPTSHDHDHVDTEQSSVTYTVRENDAELLRTTSIGATIDW